MVRGALLALSGEHVVIGEMAKSGRLGNFFPAWQGHGADNEWSEFAFWGKENEDPNPNWRMDSSPSPPKKAKIFDCPHIRDFSPPIYDYNNGLAHHSEAARPTRGMHLLVSIVSILGP